MIIKNNIIYIIVMEDTILDKEQSILFEIFELTALFLIIVYYIYNKNTILIIAYIIPFIEHIKQITCGYRQRGDSMIDKVTFFYFTIIFLFSINNQNTLSIIVSLVGIIIHLITMITKKSFSQIVYYEDIQKYLFY